MRLSGSYSYQYTLDGATRHDAGNAPATKSTHALTGACPRIGLCTPQVNWISGQTRVLTDRPSVASYNTIDVTAPLPTRRGWGGILCTQPAECRCTQALGLRRLARTPSSPCPTTTPCQGGRSMLQAPTASDATSCVETAGFNPLSESVQDKHWPIRASSKSRSMGLGGKASAPAVMARS